jgi:hypothetical protein
MLAPGHHLYSVADGGWRYCTPEETVVRVIGPDHLLPIVQQMAHGKIAREQIKLSEADREMLEHLLESLTQRGILESTGDISRSTDGQVYVAGDNPVADFLVKLLDECCDVTRGRIDEGAVIATDMVVSCAGWLPDAYWQQVDSWCTIHQTPWHRSYVEGNRFVIGPLTLPGLTACYQDTRNRRLAAAGAPEELAALWRHLDVPDNCAPIQWPEAGAAVVAGLLAEDVLATLAGSPAPSQGYQLVVDLSTAHLNRHRVLPIPVVASGLGEPITSLTLSGP